MTGLIAEEQVLGIFSEASDRSEVPGDSSGEQPDNSGLETDAEADVGATGDDCIRLTEESRDVVVVEEESAIGGPGAGEEVSGLVSGVCLILLDIG